MSKPEIKLKESERNPGTFSLPVKLIYKKPENGNIADIKIYPGGMVEVYFHHGMMRHELTYYVRDKIHDYFQSKLPRHNYFWRGTNNKKEIELINKKELRPSMNHADNTIEKGLSVTDHLGYVMMSGYKYGYRIRGQVIGQGSDGEIILDVNKLEPLDKAPRTLKSIEQREEKQYFAALREAVRDVGWTIEQYQAAITAFVVESEEFEQKYIFEGV